MSKTLQITMLGIVLVYSCSTTKISEIKQESKIEKIVMYMIPFYLVYNHRLSAEDVKKHYKLKITLREHNAHKFDAIHKSLLLLKASDTLQHKDIRLICNIYYSNKSKIVLHISTFGNVYNGGTMYDVDTVFLHSLFDYFSDGYKPRNLHINN